MDTYEHGEESLGFSLWGLGNPSADSVLSLSVPQPWASCLIWSWGYQVGLRTELGLV